MTDDRTPPHSLEAEMAVIGACLVDRDVASAVVPKLSHTDFYAHVHGKIYAVIASLCDAGKPHDKIAVAEALRSSGQLEDVGGIAYLSRLVSDSFQIVTSAEYYASLIREKAVLYRLYGAAHKISEIALDGEVDATAAVADAEQALRDAIAGFGENSTGGHIDTLLRDAWLQIDAAAVGGVKAQTTPWPRVDFYTGGWYGGEMIAWFGRPKDGKTSAVSQLMQHVAITSGPVVLFALEMGEGSVVRRLLGNHAQISSRTIRSGKLAPQEYDRLGEAMQHLSGLPIYIYSSARSVSQMRRTLLSIHAKTPVRAFIVDHMSFVSDVLNRHKSQTEHDALNQAYLRILGTAKEIDCVAHVVTHANRSGYDKEPTMGHIRGGGNLEGHAHTIIAPYRADPENNPEDGKFLVMANRDGGTGAVAMRFQGKLNKWSEMQVLAGVA